MRAVRVARHGSRSAVARTPGRGLRLRGPPGERGPASRPDDAALVCATRRRDPPVPAVHRADHAVVRDRRQAFRAPHNARAVAKHPLDRPASARAPRRQLRGPTARRVARRLLPASPRGPPAFRRGDRVVRRFAHALRLRGALASPARSPCWHAPAPCGHALGRPTSHSGSPEPQCTALPPPSGTRRVRSESSAGETSRLPPSLDPSVRSNPGGMTLRFRLVHPRGGIQHA
jgi:hypothetical protein